MADQNWDSILLLSKVLDKVDSKSTISNKKPKIENVKLTSVTSAPSIIWYEFHDAASGKYYYHNYGTNSTQWEKPTDGKIIPYTPPPPQQPPVVAVADEEEPKYTAVASFNRQKGSFSHSGAMSYWEMKNRQDDKAGRQLEAFVDLKELERNREETKVLRANNPIKKSAKEWAKINQEKKNQKKRKLNSWLYEDDPN